MRVVKFIVIRLASMKIGEQNGQIVSNQKYKENVELVEVVETVVKEYLYKQLKLIRKLGKLLQVVGNIMVNLYYKGFCIQEGETGEG